MERLIQYDYQEKCIDCDYTEKECESCDGTGYKTITDYMTEKDWEKHVELHHLKHVG